MNTNQRLIDLLDLLVGTLAEETCWLTKRLSNHPDFPRLRIGWRKEEGDVGQMAFITPFRITGAAYGKHLMASAYLNGAVEELRLGWDGCKVDAVCYGYAMVCRELARIAEHGETIKRLLLGLEERELGLLQEIAGRSWKDEAPRPAVLVFGLMEKGEDEKHAKEWLGAALEGASKGKARVKDLVIRSSPCDVLLLEDGAEKLESYFQESMKAIVCLAELEVAKG